MQVHPPSPIPQTKLDKMKLSDEAVNIHAFYEPATSTKVGKELVLTSDSFKEEASPAKAGLVECGIKGSLKNFNTIEEFQNVDQVELLEDAGKEMFWGKDGDLLSDLNRFVMLTFADLKQYSYQYCFNLLTISDEAFKVRVSKSMKLEKYKDDPTLLDTTLTAIQAHLTTSSTSAFIFDKEGKVSTIANLVEDPKSHIIGYFDPSNKKPSEVLKNVFIKVGAQLKDETTVRVVSIRG